jgi:hypothetical protein
MTIEKLIYFKHNMKLIELSQNLLLAVKTEQEASAFIRQLADYEAIALNQELSDDTHKIAFWVNIYNTFAQLLLKEALLRQKKPQTIYTPKVIKIAHQVLNLDEIEHGILRRSQFKYGLGYITNWLISSYEKKQRLQKRDYRIHFALNCGAKSCPPIAFYKPQTLDNQLDMATQSYLESTSKYEKTTNTVYIAKLMFWFKGDFGGTAGIIEMLAKYGIIPPTLLPKIKFQTYDWAVELNKFAYPQ